MKIELQFDEDPGLLIAYSDTKPQFSVGDELSMKVKVDGIRLVAASVALQESAFWIIDLIPAGIMKPDLEGGGMFLHATLETTP